MPPERPTRKEVQNIAPDQVPQDVLEARQKLWPRDAAEESSQQLPSPEKDFDHQKQLMLQAIEKSITRADVRLRAINNKLGDPMKRVRRDKGVFQSDEALIEAQKEAESALEESLAIAELQRACIRTSRATTLEAFRAELSQAEREAAKELERAYDERAAPSVMQMKQKALRAMTELEHTIEHDAL